MIEVFNNKDELIQKLTSLATDGRFVFRGYSIQDQMLPNLIRKKAVDIEMELLYRFEKYAGQYLSVNNPIDFLSYAQHFGLSTRLLDFTYNPFVALYFALFKDKPTKANNPEDKEYYYIRYCDVQENLCLEEIPIINEGEFFQSLSMAENCKKLFQTLEIMYGHSTTYPLLNRDAIVRTISLSSRNKDNRFLSEYEILSRLSNNNILLIDPNQSNQRIVMQQGLFMLCYSLDEDKHKRIISDNTHLIKIHKRLREDLQTYLNTIGITAYRLMPDLASVCSAVEQQVRDERKRKSSLFKKKSY
jgi:hypothetical protein